MSIPADFKKHDNQNIALSQLKKSMNAEQGFEKLKKENKKLRTINTILTIYVVLSLFIMAYNYFK